MAAANQIVFRNWNNPTGNLHNKIPLPDVIPAVIRPSDRRSGGALAAEESSGAPSGPKSNGFRVVTWSVQWRGRSSGA
ncbi:hypothetical protein LINPERHAP2_LOCUS9703 [Linum perenne]